MSIFIIWKIKLLLFTIKLGIQVNKILHLLMKPLGLINKNKQDLKGFFFLTHFFSS